MEDVHSSCSSQLSMVTPARLLSAPPEGGGAGVGTASAAGAARARDAAAAAELKGSACPADEGWAADAEVARLWPLPAPLPHGVHPSPDLEVLCCRNLQSEHSTTAEQSRVKAEDPTPPLDSGAAAAGTVAACADRESQASSLLSLCCEMPAHSSAVGGDQAPLAVTGQNSGTRLADGFVDVLSLDEVTVLKWPLDMICYTVARPSVSHCCNPLHFDFRASASSRGRPVPAAGVAVVGVVDLAGDDVKAVVGDIVEGLVIDALESASGDAATAICCTSVDRTSLEATATACNGSKASSESEAFFACKKAKAGGIRHRRQYRWKRKSAGGGRGTDDGTAAEGRGKDADATGGGGGATADNGLLEAEAGKCLEDGQRKKRKSKKKKKKKTKKKDKERRQKRLPLPTKSHEAAAIAANDPRATPAVSAASAQTTGATAAAEEANGACLTDDWKRKKHKRKAKTETSKAETAEMQQQSSRPNGGACTRSPITSAATSAVAVAAIQASGDHGLDTTGFATDPAARAQLAAVELQTAHLSCSGGCDGDWASAGGGKEDGDAGKPAEGTRRPTSADGCVRKKAGSQKSAVLSPVTARETPHSGSEAAMLPFSTNGAAPSALLSGAAVNLVAAPDADRSASVAAYPVTAAAAGAANPAPRARKRSGGQASSSVSCAAPPAAAGAQSNDIGGEIPLKKIKIAFKPAHGGRAAATTDRAVLEPTVVSRWDSSSSDSEGEQRRKATLAAILDESRSGRRLGEMHSADSASIVAAAAVSPAAAARGLPQKLRESLSGVVSGPPQSSSSAAASHSAGTATVLGGHIASASARAADVLSRTDAAAAGAVTVAVSRSPASDAHSSQQGRSRSGAAQPTTTCRRSLRSSSSSAPGSHDRSESARSRSRHRRQSSVRSSRGRRSRSSSRRRSKSSSSGSGSRSDCRRSRRRRRQKRHGRRSSRRRSSDTDSSLGSSSESDSRRSASGRSRRRHRRRRRRTRSSSADRSYSSESSSSSPASRGRRSSRRRRRRGHRRGSSSSSWGSSETGGSSRSSRSRAKGRRRRSSSSSLRRRRSVSRTIAAVAPLGSSRLPPPLKRIAPVAAATTAKRPTAAGGTQLRPAGSVGAARGPQLPLYRPPGAAKPATAAQQQQAALPAGWSPALAAANGASKQQQQPSLLDQPAVGGRGDSGTSLSSRLPGDGDGLVGGAGGSVAATACPALPADLPADAHATTVQPEADAQGRPATAGKGDKQPFIGPLRPGEREDSAAGQSEDIPLPTEMPTQLLQQRRAAAGSRQSPQPAALVVAEQRPSEHRHQGQPTSPAAPAAMLLPPEQTEMYRGLQEQAELYRELRERQQRMRDAALRRLGGAAAAEDGCGADQQLAAPHEAVVQSYAQQIMSHRKAAAFPPPVGGRASPQSAVALFGPSAAAAALHQQAAAAAAASRAPAQAGLPLQAGSPMILAGPSPAAAAAAAMHAQIAAHHQQQQQQLVAHAQAVAHAQQQQQLHAAAASGLPLHLAGHPGLLPASGLGGGGGLPGMPIGAHPLHGFHMGGLGPATGPGGLALAHAGGLSHLLGPAHPALGPAGSQMLQLGPQLVHLPMGAAMAGGGQPFVMIQGTPHILLQRIPRGL